MKPIIFPLAIAGLLVAGNATADGFALGVKAGTLGAGLEATKGLSDGVNLRLGLNSYRYDFDETASGIRYDAELDLRSGALIFDWHPFAGTFRLSAGALYNKNELRLVATGNQTIGGTTYPNTRLNGEVKFKTAAPYVGLGWGNAVGKGSALGFNLEIGAMFQGKPDVTLTESTGTVSQADLRSEEQQAEDDLDDFKIYPVISLGLSYRF